MPPIASTLSAISGLNRHTYQRLQLALQLNLRRQLFVAVCDDLNLRNGLAHQLQADLNAPTQVLSPAIAEPAVSPHSLPRFVTLNLNLNDPNPMSQMAQWLTEHCNPVSGSGELSIPNFQILGIERLTRQPAAVQRLFLSYLQGIERSLSGLESSVLLWLPRPWFCTIQASAPEFWRWHTAIFEFVGDPTPESTESEDGEFPAFQVDSFEDWLEDEHSDSNLGDLAADSHTDISQTHLDQDIWSILSHDLSLLEQVSSTEDAPQEDDREFVDLEAIAPKLASLESPNSEDESSELALEALQSEVAATLAEQPAIELPELIPVDAMDEETLAYFADAAIDELSNTDGIDQALEKLFGSADLFAEFASAPGMETMADLTVTEALNLLELPLPDVLADDPVPTLDVQSTALGTTSVSSEVSSSGQENVDSAGWNSLTDTWAFLAEPFAANAIEADRQVAPRTEEDSRDRLLSEELELIDSLPLLELFSPVPFENLTPQTPTSTNPTTIQGLESPVAPSIANPIDVFSPIPFGNLTHEVPLDEEALSSLTVAPALANETLISGHEAVVPTVDALNPTLDESVSTESTPDLIDSICNETALATASTDTVDNSLAEGVLLETQEEAAIALSPTSAGESSVLDASEEAAAIALPPTSELASSALDVTDPEATTPVELEVLQYFAPTSTTEIDETLATLAFEADPELTLESFEAAFESALVESTPATPAQELSMLFSLLHNEETEEQTIANLKAALRDTDEESIQAALEQIEAFAVLPQSPPLETELQDFGADAALSPEAVTALAPLTLTYTGELLHLILSEAIDSVGKGQASLKQAIEQLKAPDATLSETLVTAFHEFPPLQQVQTIERLHQQGVAASVLAAAYQGLGNFYRDRIEQGDVSQENLGIAIRVYETLLTLLSDETSSAKTGSNGLHPSIPQPEIVLPDVLNDLGNLYWLLSRCPLNGEDKQAYLKKGIETYETALLKSNATLQPTAYAMIQNNLGAAFGDLARYQEPAENLQRSIQAYQEVLQYRKPELEPLKYASTQNNLGTTYWHLAQHQRPVAHLKQAIAAYADALRYYDAEQDPLSFAMIQNNMGTAYWNLAQYEVTDGFLLLAIDAYQNALKYRTPETTPVGYAATQNNLGTAYWHLANHTRDNHENRRESLEQAIGAYETALTTAHALSPNQKAVLTFDLFATHNNLGLSHFQLATDPFFPLDANQQSSHLEAALKHHLQALMGWQNRSEFAEVALKQVVQTIQAFHSKFGFQGQNRALSLVPAQLLATIMGRL